MGVCPVVVADKTSIAERVPSSLEIPLFFRKALISNDEKL
jgi:hypothetical protein